MPVNWGIQDFNLGQARNKLDLAPAINIYQNAKKVNAQRNLADLELDKEARRKKKSEEIQQMRMASISPDGKADTQGYIQRLTQSGYTDEAVKEQKLFNDRQKSIFEQNKQLENTLDRHAKTYSNLETDVEKQDFFNKNIAPSPLMKTKQWNPQVDAEIMASTVKPLTQKEQFERDKMDRDNRLSEEFRTKFLPGLDITGLETDKNKINRIRKDILMSPYAKSSLAKETLKALKAPQASMAEQLSLVLGKEERKEDRKRKERERKRAEGGSFKSTQYVAANYGNRMKGAIDEMEALYESGYRRGESGQRILNFLPGEMTPEQRQQQDQAERNFVNANLRRESGAAIAPSEFSSAEKQYFPRPGDKPAVIEQKRRNRLRAISAMKAEAGGAWDEVEREFETLYTPRKIGKYEVIE